jgi:SET domain-containing protein
MFRSTRSKLATACSSHDRARRPEAGVNHSCEPNTRRLTHHGTLYATAMRDIRAGEELLVSYLTLDELQLLVHQRRALLQSKYSFMCECSRCVREASYSRCVML